MNRVGPKLVDQQLSAASSSEKSWQADRSLDPYLESWIDSANVPDADFPIQNLPFGMFRRANDTCAPTVCVAIGDMIVDLRKAASRVQWPSNVCGLMSLVGAGDLNDFAARPASQRRLVRQALSAALTRGSDLRSQVERCLAPQREAVMLVPCAIGDHTEFGSDHHRELEGTAGHVRAVPHGWDPRQPEGRAARTSTIGASGHQLLRPRAPVIERTHSEPLQVSSMLDYGVGLAAWVGRPNAAGEAVAAACAEEHAFGIGMIINWLARDFLDADAASLLDARSFATTVSPWVITFDALRPFRIPVRRDGGRSRPFDYLEAELDMRRGGISMSIAACIETPMMRRLGLTPQHMASFRVSDARWTISQLIARQTVTGCQLRAGDLLSLALSAEKGGEGAGSLHALTRNGAKPLTLPSGECRAFLDDGDTVVLRAHCYGPDARRIGFGECRGTVSSRAAAAKRKAA